MCVYAHALETMKTLFCTPIFVYTFCNIHFFLKKIIQLSRSSFIYGFIMSFWDYRSQISNYRISFLLWIFRVIIFIACGYWKTRWMLCSLFSLNKSYVTQLLSHFSEHSSTCFTCTCPVTVHNGWALLIIILVHSNSFFQS